MVRRFTSRTQPDRKGNPTQCRSLSALPRSCGIEHACGSRFYRRIQRFMSEHVVAYEVGFRHSPTGGFSSIFNVFQPLRSSGLFGTGAGSLGANPGPCSICHAHHVREPAVWHNGRRRGLRQFKTYGSLDVEPRLRIPEVHLQTQPSSQDTLLHSRVRRFEPRSIRRNCDLTSDLSHGLSWDANAYFVSALRRSRDLTQPCFPKLTQTD